MKSKLRKNMKICRAKIFLNIVMIDVRKIIRSKLLEAWTVGLKEKV